MFELSEIDGVVIGKDFKTFQELEKYVINYLLKNNLLEIIIKGDFENDDK